MPAPANAKTTLRQRLAAWASLSMAALSFSLAVLAPNTAAAATAVVSNPIVNMAIVSYTDAFGARITTDPSNSVAAASGPSTPVVQFYTDATFTTTTSVTQLGAHLYVQAAAPLCNRNAGIVESVTIDIISVRTGYTGHYKAVETTANSGVFRIVDDPTTAVAGGASTSSTGDQAEVARNDSVTATLTGCGPTATAMVRVDPTGIVFDSSTNAVVAGATVTLVDVTGAGNGGRANAPARVMDYDGVTPLPSVVVTGADGRYTFPVVGSSSYKLIVQPPSGRTFPSVVPIAKLDASRQLNASGSYGGAFDVSDTTTLVTIDVPVDPVSHGLAVTKTASRTSVELAESLEYTVVVQNIGQIGFADVAVNDQLPVGFTLVRGSATLDGARAAEPVGGKGPNITFAAGILGAGASHTLRYRVVIGPGALQGDATNRVTASATQPIATTSNLASVRVKVEPGVFTDTAMVLGTVWADCNANGVKDPEEVGVPGVRLFMEDGTFVTTDGKGRYSLYGISPRTHVLKIDSTSLPEGAVMSVLSNRNSGDGNSRFVDPRKGELSRADFAVSGCSPALMAEIARRAGGLSGDRELALSLKTELRPDGVAPKNDVRSLPAAGLVGQTQGLVNSSGEVKSNAPVGTGPLLGVPSLEAPVANGSAVTPLYTTAVADAPLAQSQDMSGDSADSTAPSQVAATASVAAASSSTPATTVSTPAAAAEPASIVPAAAVVQPRLEDMLGEVDNQLGFIDLADGQVLRHSQPSVRVKSMMGAKVLLKVDGVEVGEDRIGERVQRGEDKIELREYVGLPLHAGENTLTLTESDNFGNVRAVASVRVIVPGEVAKIRIGLPSKPVDADGVSIAPIRVELLDAAGVRVTGRRQVTLDASAGEWQLRDLDPRDPGVQVFVEDGLATFGLRAPGNAGDADIAVRIGSGSAAPAGTLPMDGNNNATARARLSFVPALRPLLAVGIVEGAINLRKLNPKSVVPAQSDDGFEEELSSVSMGGDNTAGGRAAVFLKGKVRGDTLLTLGYDSAKPTGTDGTRLFRDIQPDAFYPVYGDSSVKGYDAQSTGKLYVRLEQGKSYLLYGDFTTQTVETSKRPARQLGLYQRSLTGIKEHYDADGVTANVWAARTTTTQVIVELPGNGTSGPFLLNGINALENSEKVEILVRDRNQPALILASTTLARFTDYDFEPLTGRILLRAPLPSVDANLNPQSLRVSYEVETGGAAFYVAGADAQVKLTDALEVGGSAVRDWNPLEPFKMGSANASFAITDKTLLSAEAAHLSRELGTLAKPGATAGSAERVELNHDGESFKLRAYLGRSDVGFDNLSSTLSSGRSEGGVKSSYAIDQNTRLVGEAIHSGDVTSQVKRDGVLLGVERSFDNGVKLEAGVRHVHDVPLATTTTGTAVTAAAADTETDTTSVRAKVSTIVPSFPLATVYAEAEQDVRDADKRLLAVGGQMQLADRGRLYARHELISSLSGPYALDSTQRRNTTVVGLDGNYMDDGRVFSEYRGRDAFTGRETEAAIGLRNGFTLAQGVRLTTTVESTQPIVRAISGTTTALDPRSAAATGAIDYTADPRLKGTARLEVRDATSSRSVLATLGAAYKLSDDWTGLAKFVRADTFTKDVTDATTGLVTTTPDRLQERFQIGVAYRDTATNRMNGLARYEFKREAGVSTDESSRTVHSVTGHIDYQATRSLTLTAQEASKFVQETVEGGRLSNSAHLMAARATYDLGNDWDVGVAARMLTDGRFAARQYGLGAEAGYQVRKNTWVSVGYNVSGFSDRDLTSDNDTRRGAYVRLRFKFDESIFQGSKS